MLKTATLATIYELQGYKEDALSIYRDILKEDPDNKEAKAAIRRLAGSRKKFSGVNVAMRDFFVQMQSDVELREFERWLLRGF